MVKTYGILSCLAMILIITLCSCATKPIIKSSAINNDIPVISKQDAIAIAQQHVLKNPINYTEVSIGRELHNTPSTNGWVAVYNGRGKWTVYYQGYQWSVFENGLTAVFLGAY
jgi:hypothetical protein